MGGGKAEGYVLVIEVLYFLLMLSRSPSVTAWPEKMTVITSSGCEYNTDSLPITMEIGRCFSFGLTTSSFNFCLIEFGIPLSAKGLNTLMTRFSFTS